MSDPFDLRRFVDAQSHTYDQALAELRAVEKRTHWMWLTDLDTADPVRVFRPVDAQEQRSSMTLFAHAAPDEPVFRAVLDQYFDGTEDDATTRRI